MIGEEGWPTGESLGNRFDVAPSRNFEAKHRLIGIRELTESNLQTACHYRRWGCFLLFVS